jgi:hypothetical protein
MLSEMKIGGGKEPFIVWKHTITGIGIWDLGFGIWDLGFGIWIWDRALASVGDNQRENHPVSGSR